jgi:hypothetical protein
MVLRLIITALNGPLKGQRIPLYRGQLFSGSVYADDTMQENHAEVEIDSSVMWVVRARPYTLNQTDTPRIRLGSVETEKISLIPGVIFHIGQTGFKVSEVFASKQVDLTDETLNRLENLELKTSEPTLTMFDPPIRLTFVKGPQAGDVFTLAYGPRILGSHQSDLNLVEPGLPHRAIELGVDDLRPSLKNLTSYKVQINDADLTEHFISPGDVVKIGSSEIEITLLS